MSNSALVTYTRLTPHKSTRTHKIDTITIHCYVGQVTAKQGCDMFATTSRSASCNYVVGRDGSIGLCVEEKNRSWCTDSRDNDNRAVTIETASDNTYPYAVTPEAYSALIKLVADICVRNGIKKLLWKADKSLIGRPDLQNMTVHRWFAYKECPGQWLYERHGEIAEKVNAIIADYPEPVEPTGPANYIVATEKITKQQADEAVKALKSLSIPFNVSQEAPEPPSTAKTYTVKKGDSLYTIAQRELGDGSRWPEIKQINGLTSSVINPGQVLILP